MPYSQRETDECVVLEPDMPANSAVIWLHGLGADGFDFVPIVKELNLPATAAVRFLFPHARPRPVTINNGFVMRAWYDIRSLGGSGVEDDAGIRESAGIVGRYIGNRVLPASPPAASVLQAFHRAALSRCMRAFDIHNALRASWHFQPTCLYAARWLRKPHLPIATCRFSCVTVCTIRSCRQPWVWRRAICCSR